MYKQRLLKVIFCITLVISVFLYQPSVSLARDITDEDFTGAIEVWGEEWLYLNDVVLSDITPGQESNAAYGTVGGKGVFNANVTGLELGRTYSGYCMIGLHMRQALTDGTSGTTWHRWTVNFEPITFIDGIAMAVSGYSTGASDGVDMTLYLYFNNWYNDIGDRIRISFNVGVTHGFYTNDGSVPYAHFVRTETSSDWAGTLFQRLPENGSQLELDAIQDQSAQLGQISQQEMQQQQQIADQQAQQSAQQHEDLKEGFTDNTYNNNVSNAGSQVDSYIDLEHNLLEQQNQQMSEYADTAFNLNTISPYINAIAMTSTFFTWIWNGYGELNVVFVIVLAIGVACLILGIRRRG